LPSAAAADAGRVEARHFFDKRRRGASTLIYLDRAIGTGV